jgi:predicted transcriptional regulator
MRTQMESGLTDEAIDQMAEQVKGRFERDEVERLLKSIKRTLVFTDSEKGSSAMVAFCDTEECRCPVRHDVAGR